MGAGGGTEVCIMTYGVATLHTDYIRSFSLLGRLVGGGA